MDLPARVKQAIRWHQQGDLDQAEHAYQEILQDAPHQFDALHLLGVIARQRGDLLRAVELISRAIHVDGAQAGAHCNLGVALEDMRQSQAALACFERAIALQPQHALSWNNRGNAMRVLGRFDDALYSYQQAIEHRPAYPEAFFNRGITCQSARRHVSALASFEQAIALRPNYPEAWCAAGASLQNLQRYAEAIAHYDRAIALRPEYPEAICNRGTALQRCDDFSAALMEHERALTLRPQYARAHLCRGNSLRALQRPDEAIAAFRLAARHGADSEHVAYQIAALGEGTAPAVAPPSYVRELFDEYADHFEQHLLQRLEYAVPQTLAAAVRRHVRGSRLQVLDLGCGTGLCGAQLRDVAHTLTGVDLSPNMLEQARAAGHYDALHCAEGTAWLSTASEVYELIVAADVLVYFGDLAALFGAVRSALRGGGVFGFSVEANEAGDYVLGPSQRYAHSREYLERLAQHQGFDVKEMVRQPLRRDGGVHVEAWLAVLQIGG